MSGIRPNGERFPSAAKKHIMPLKGNVYINPADPRFHDKVLQYAHGSSPEALYRVGLKLIREGRREQGMELLRRCAQTRTGYGAKAKAEWERLRREPSPMPPLRSAGKERRARNVPWLWMSALLAIGFALIWIAALSPIGKTLTQILLPSPPIEVYFEAYEQPFLIYIDATKTPAEVETMLYDEIRELGSRYPDQMVQIYGLYRTAGNPEGMPLPLQNPDLKREAFVLAEYHADAGDRVRIRFFALTDRGADSQSAEPSVRIAANLVRTALLQFQEDRGRLPERLRELFGDYPGNYLSFLPPESVTGTTAVMHAFDGTGGWIYNPAAAGIETVFRPNLEQYIPYEPIEIWVETSSNKLYLTNDHYILAEKRVGLGRDDSTPVGEFRIEQRVLDPLGASPGVYGAAGLGFGKWALHGTNEPESIGANVSLGCIRLSDQDILELFPYVPLGTRVIIKEEHDIEGFDRLEPARETMMAAWSAEPSGQREAAGPIRFAWLQ